MTPIEIAVYLSHESVVRKFVESNRQFAVLFEDDTTLDATMRGNLQRIVAMLPSLGCHALYLFNCDAENTAQYRRPVDNILLTNPITKEEETVTICAETRAHNAGQQAYVISRSLALAILERTKIRCPMDMLIGMVLHRMPEFKNSFFTLPMIDDTTSHCAKNPKYANSEVYREDVEFICDDPVMKRKLLDSLS